MATYKKGDTSPDYTGQLKSNGVPKNATGATLELHFKKPSGTVLTKAGAWTDASVGTYSSTWATGDLNEAGAWQMEPKVTFSNGKIQTWPTLFFAVEDVLS